jgi:UDP-glucose:(heptosyl)LPS alpha-1,3-glucosyltransferase
MKIAIVRKKYTFHGGAEGFSQDFIGQLAKMGHKIHIYAISWNGPASSENIFFHKVPALTFNSLLRDLTFNIFSYLMLKKEKYDIIQSHDKTLYQDIYRAGDGCHIEWLKQKWKRTGILGKMSIIFNPYHWMILAIENRIFKRHRYKKIIAISEMVKKNIIDNYGVPASDIEVIYNGVDLQRFNPGNKERYRTEIRKKYGISDTEFVILFIGSGFERKGVRYLIQAVELLEEPVTLLIVGKGKLRNLETASHQKIIFCGPQRENFKYYAAADIFVFPTIYEPFGNVHLEALASGLPVITTKNSGASEILQDGLQGFVIEYPEDIRKLAEKIQFLYYNRNKLEKMKKDARLFSEQFSLKKHIEEMLAFYKKLL